MDFHRSQRSDPADPDSAPPSSASEDFGPLESLQPAVVAQWRLQGMARIAVLGVVAWAALPELVGNPPALRPAIAAFVGALTVWLWVHTRLRHRRFRFAIDERNLYVRDGVVIHRDKVIPVQRMQHVDIYRGPLERLLGLASLSVYTAGGAGATFRLPGLSPQRGEMLRDRVLSARDTT